MVLESMKMATVLHAPFRAVPEESLVSVGSQVETGAPLLRLEPLDVVGAAPGTAGAELDLPAEPAGLSAGQRAERGLADLRSRLLGFDVDPRDADGTLTGYLATRAELPHRPLAAEAGLLEIFAD